TIVLVDGVLYAACDQVEKRKVYFPSGGRWPKNDVETWENSGSGRVYAIDAKTLKTTRLDVSTIPGGNFTSHGLGVFPSTGSDNNKVSLFLVNHHPSGSRIEVLTYEKGAKKAIWKESISHGQLNAPNSVYPIDDASFYVTNDKKNRRGVLEVVEVFTGAAASLVMYHDSKDGVTRTVAKDIVYANGIVSSRDGEWVFVASSGTASVLIYKRNPDNGGLKLAQRLQLYLIPDNLSIDRVTGTIYVAGFATVVDSVKLMVLRDEHSAKKIAVMKIVPNSGEQVFYGRPWKVEAAFYTEDSRFASVTTAVVDSVNKKTFFGGMYTSGVIVCDGVI
ncbi:UNVERIFIED_CONTAM: Serum paraoxonase/arylesterase 1, partial [Siphonaria sp. JEL0065]